MSKNLDGIIEYLCGDFNQGISFLIEEEGLTDIEVCESSNRYDPIDVRVDYPSQNDLSSMNCNDDNPYIGDDEPVFDEDNVFTVSGEGKTLLVGVLDEDEVWVYNPEEDELDETCHTDATDFIWKALS